MISVIVPAYNRSQFVSQAVDSVATQKKIGDELEILVVTNLDLPSDFFRTPGTTLRILRSEDRHFGGMISGAIEASSGEVVAFLDDDDLWYEDKLIRVREAFSAHPDLALYHNRSRPIDVAGSPLLQSLDAPGRRGRLRSESSVLDPKRASFSQIRHAVLGGMDTNHSSMVVRRAVLTDNLPILRQIQKSADSFMFYSALASGGPLLEDPTILTGYRVHGQSSMLHDLRQGPEAPKFYSDVGRLNSIYHSDHLLLRQLRGGRLPPNVRKALGCQLAEDQIHIDFFSSERRKPILAQHVVSYFRAASVSDMPYSVLLTGYGLANLVSHRLTESLYANWASSRHLS